MRYSCLDLRMRMLLHLHVTWGVLGLKLRMLLMLWRMYMRWRLRRWLPTNRMVPRVLQITPWL